MKKFTNSIKGAAVLLAAFVLTSSTASATVFTAAASGNWNAAATWGGTAPSYNVTSDQIIIPVGITVALTNNLSINGSGASLDIEGALTDNATDTLTIGQGSITGVGAVTVNGLMLNTGAVLGFAGTLAVQDMTNMSNGLALTAHTTVGHALYLAGGIFSLQTGGIFTMNAGTAIIVSGGTMVSNGGSLVLSHSYDVTYNASAASITTGLEATGTGLSNVTINATGSNTVTLAANTSVGGTLTLSSGALVLGGHNLLISGDIAAGGSGTISSDGNSNLLINTAGPVSGSLNFTPSSNTINNMSVSVGGSGTLSLGSDLTVNGTLTLSNGKLNVGSNGLRIAASGAIAGAGTSNYIIASGTGYLAVAMTGGNPNWTNFPVGTATAYSPVELQLNSGSASGAARVSVGAGVYSHGTTGVDLSTSQALVAMTYFVEPDSQTNTNLNMKLMWASSLEVNGFNRDSAYISHYTSGAWDAHTVGSATASGSLYAMERDSVSTFSPFSVVGSRANTSTLGVSTVAAAQFSVYPNPATDRLTIRTAGSDSYTMDILDITGQNVASYKINGTDNTISVAGLTAGSYFIKLTDGQSTVTNKFVKM